jgi:membrane protein implicated in regulation of membrane protease activity
MTWFLWIIAACSFVMGEIVTMGQFLAPFALAAALAAVIAGLGAGLVPSFVSFAIASVFLLVVIRPLVVSHRRVPMVVRTGAARLTGARAVVLERIASNQAGSVRIGGEAWAASAYGDEILEAGAAVTVIEIRGATAWVTE